MKKILLIVGEVALAVAVFAGTLFGAGLIFNDKISAEDAVKALNNTFSFVEDTENMQLDADFNAGINAVVNGVKMEYSASGNIKLVMADNELEGMLFNGTISYFGIGMNLLMFKGSDGDLHIDYMGMQQSFDMTEMNNARNSPEYAQIEKTFNNFKLEKYIKDAKKTKTKEGTRYETIINSEQLFVFLGEEILGGIELPDDLELGDLTIILQLDKNDRPESMNLLISVTQQSKRENFTYDVNLLITYNSFENVVIDISKYEK